MGHSLSKGVCGSEFCIRVNRVPVPAKRGKGYDVRLGYRPAHAYDRLADLKFLKEQTLRGTQLPWFCHGIASLF
jgi:hypothetical protein